MKGQMSIEFLVILFILVAYLSVVFSLFSSARSSLERAVDNKVEQRISKWTSFIASRPEGTEIKIEIKPFPNRDMRIRCGALTTISHESGEEILNISSVCSPLNITEKTCLSLESRAGGVKIEVC